MNTQVMALSLALILAFPATTLAAQARRGQSSATTQGKAAASKREPSPWMKEAQRQNQLKAQERQKTLKKLQGSLDQQQRDRQRNRVRTTPKVNRNMQQLIIYE